jgi:hypothetical protein
VQLLAQVRKAWMNYARSSWKSPGTELAQLPDYGAKVIRAGKSLQLWITIVLLFLVDFFNCFMLQYKRIGQVV